jgi:hypothetical protein
MTHFKDEGMNDRFGLPMGDDVENDIGSNDNDNDNDDFEEKSYDTYNIQTSMMTLLCPITPP